MHDNLPACLPKRKRPGQDCWRDAGANGALQCLLTGVGLRLKCSCLQAGAPSARSNKKKRWTLKSPIPDSDLLPAHTSSFDPSPSIFFSFRYQTYGGNSNPSIFFLEVLCRTCKSLESLVYQVEAALQCPVFGSDKVIQLHFWQGPLSTSIHRGLDLPHASAAGHVPATSCSYLFCPSTRKQQNLARQFHQEQKK